ncbi:unnamed protein product [Effrenium voratum]|nr:unnamed protein product [Effrenium voratum]
MGGTRFIGCYLVAKLRELGHKVVVCNRGKTNGGKPAAWRPYSDRERLPGVSDAEYAKMLEGVDVLIADRKNPDQLRTAVSAAGQFDIVFDNNVRTLADIEPLVRGIKAKGGCQQFIMMSSAGVYGPTDVLPLSESTPGDPNSRHKDKLACEQYLAAEGLNWTSIRPVYIYGPLNYNPVERYFFDRVSRNRPVCIPYGGKYITQLGHCEDLADFMAKCVGNAAVSGQVFNVSSEEYVTFDGMAKVCAAAAGVGEPKIVHYDPKSVEVPKDFPKAFPFRGMHFFASIEKAKRQVPSWRPKYNMFEGLKSSFELDYLARGFDKKDPDFRTDDLILQKAGVSAGASSTSSSGNVRHGIGYPYSFQKDAYADLQYGNDVGYLPDGTPMNAAGNAINHPETIQPDPHSPGSPLPRAIFANDVGYLPDGTPLNRAGNAINHPETIGPDPHSPGSPLPASAYAAEVGYLVDGTPIATAGNNSLRFGYRGQVAQGLRDGLGELRLPSGAVYRGQWELGVRSGHGEWQHPKRGSYLGQWKNNQMHGEGLLKANGVKYQGTFSEGRFHEEGELCLADGTVFAGRWRKGLEHGLGRLRLPDGKCYEGQWVKGEVEGQGTLTYGASRACFGRSELLALLFSRGVHRFLLLHWYVCATQASRQGHGSMLLIILWVVRSSAVEGSS